MKKTFDIKDKSFQFSFEEDVNIGLEAVEDCNGIELFRICFDWANPCCPQPIKLSYSIDCVDCYGSWDPIGKLRFLPFGSKQDTESQLGYGMPLKGVYSRNGSNAYLLALSDVKSPIKQCIRASSLGGALQVTVEFFTMLTGPFSHYEALLRIDTRRIAFHQAICDARAWFEALGYANAYLPDAATLPMYSTWYSYGKEITAKDVLRECEAAAASGMKAVIIDDGWQTDRTDTLYGYCGDWQPVPRKFPDMRALCDRIHALGMKVLLWFSVPFMGKYAARFADFRGMYLRYCEAEECYVLDPRYKQVREFITALYANAVKDWGLDGLKLDFIDRFKANGEVQSGMDFVSVEDAVKQLLDDISSALRKINPEILIEFRQPYFGPVVSAYGNMMRVWDCPLDPVMNRNQTLNLRLTLGKCAVHSDMVYWNRADKPECVALQLWGTLFSVPQISARMQEMTDAQRAVLDRYLAFWNQHRDTLVNGRLDVRFTENGYGYAQAAHQGEVISLLTVHTVLEPSPTASVCYGINLTDSERIILRHTEGAPLSFRVYDCLGNALESATLSSPLQEVQIPLGGMIVLQR